MPRLVNQNPSYRKHKASGQAIVTLNGEDIYLGPYGTKASRTEYDRVIGEWLTRGRERPGVNTQRRVADVIKAYWDHAQGYYGTEGGRGELDCIKSALSILRRTYGETPARDFGPLALQVMRERMIKEGWSRTYLNAQVGRIKRCFKWASSRELIPPSVFHGLQAVDGLRRGKCDARETDPVKPVPEDWVEATIERGRLSRQVEGLIRLQLASGMRPGEAVIMRGCDIDASGEVWTYTPAKHKTQHHGHERAIFLGPQAKAVIERFLKPDLQAFLFSPADAERERREALSAARKTPESCGNKVGDNRARRPEKAPGKRYTVRSYYRAITCACDSAFPSPEHLARQRVPANGRKAKNGKRWETLAEWQMRLGKEKWAELRKWREEHRWHPHQLRHTAATRLRKLHGLEAARVILGHKSAAVAEIYAEIDQAKAREIMGEVG